VLVIDRSTGTHDARTAALDEIGARLSSPTLLVGDVWIVLEPGERTRCGVKFAGYVHLRVRPAGAALAATPDFIVRAAHEAADAPVEAIAQAPETLREQMRTMLRALAEKVIDSYPWR
jgi:hypothetical protein